MVIRGQGKGGSDDSRVPTSKFISSKSRSGQLGAQNSTCLHSSTTSAGGYDLNNPNRLSEDVQVMSIAISITFQII